MVDRNESLIDKRNDLQAFPDGLIAGMSLRDYIAAHCPISHGDAFHLISEQTEVGTVDCNRIMEEFCRMRYEYADAMLKARQA